MLKVMNANNMFNSLFNLLALSNKPTNRTQNSTLNLTKDYEYSLTLEEIDSWLTITLSSISCIALIVFTVIYVVAQVQARDHIKETKTTAFRKLYRHEYLVFSYCFTLFFSHFLSIAQKVILEYYTNGINTVDSYCVIIGILRHFFWLATIFHSNAVSVKIYLKLTKAANNNLLERKDWHKAALKIFAYIHGSALVIIILSISIHYGKTQDVYDLRSNDKLNRCFLSQPLYLVLFFALPITVIVITNCALFIIVVCKTKSTVDQSESEEMNNFFLKLAIIMGLPWLVYVFSIILIESYGNHYYAQSITIITTCQINLQGFGIVMGLFSHAAYEKLCVNHKKKHHRHHPNNNHANPNNNQQGQQHQQPAKIKNKITAL